MKNMKKITTLLLSLTMVLMMSQAAFAENGGTFTYRGGSTIEGDEAAQKPIDFSGLEPGDSMELEFTYVNDSDEDTVWYLSNDVIKSLEDGSDATDGGYTYELTNKGVKEGTVTIFRSDAVGGDETLDPDTEDKGLHDATNALGDDWIYIDELAPGEKGSTILKVALDGESQANVYQTTEGQLKIAYAVETIVGEDQVIHYGKKINTGDETNLFLLMGTFLGSLLLLILVILSYRKDRKDGEEA